MQSPTRKMGYNSGAFIERYIKLFETTKSARNDASKWLEQQSNLGYLPKSDIAKITTPDTF